MRVAKLTVVSLYSTERSYAKEINAHKNDFGYEVLTAVEILQGHTNKVVAMGAAAYLFGNTNSRMITEVKQR